MKSFVFFEKVKVLTTSTYGNEYLVGKIGVVIGMTPVDEDSMGNPDFSEIVAYRIKFDDEKYSYSFLPEELESTGEIIKKEDYYSGASIRVSVDEKGRGFLLDKEPRSEEEASRRKEMGWE